ncbi:MAG TPA: hypothetical protein VJR89_32665, partial [Polyangiales bacterium]|nr:hypothetical protein [Polyangiales bacterium]
MRLAIRSILVVAAVLVTRTAQAEIAPIGKCGDPATPIHDIQGSGTHTGVLDQAKVIEGVVVGDFQTTSLRGFYVQEEDDQRDADPATSEGMFVFQSDNTTDVRVGQLVRVGGNVAEFDGTTELTNVWRVLICPGTPVASPVELSLPVRDRGELERYEGMLVNVAQQLTVTGNHLLARYGTLELSAGGRLLTPTQLAPKGDPAR